VRQNHAQVANTRRRRPCLRSRPPPSTGVSRPQSHSLRGCTREGTRRPARPQRTRSRS
jgi:hypothetical protein